MSVNGQNRDGTGNGGALRWSGRVITADDLRHSLNGERELIVTPRTVITPLAADHLKDNGVKVLRRDESAKPQAREQQPTGSWGYVLERPDSLAHSVAQSLQREGILLQEIASSAKRDAGRETIACGLAQEAAQAVGRADWLGLIVFCLDPLLVCCIANKVKGIRAAALASPTQANQAVRGLGVNLLALEIGKQTFFELLQILRCVCGSSASCYGAVAEILQELEEPCQCQPKGHGSPSVGLEQKCQCGGGHAHR